MKRMIKFRGVDTDDGNRGNTVIFTLDELLATSDDYGLVDPDSIKQFICVDKNGRDVFEDDKLICVINHHDFLRYGQKIKANICEYRDIYDGYLVLDDDVEQ